MAERIKLPITYDKFSGPSWEFQREPIEWAAVLRPSAEGHVVKGAFLQKCGASFMATGLFVDAVVEFAADTIALGPKGGKNKVPIRWYGVVRVVNKDFIEIERHVSQEQAILATNAAQPQVQRVGPSRNSLKARLAQLEDELRIVETQLYVEGLLAHRRRFDTDPACPDGENLNEG